MSGMQDELKLYKLPSDKTADCCNGHHCDYEYDSSPSEPCWGQVTVIDELWSDDDYWWVHACKGHAGRYDGEPYVKSDRPEDSKEVMQQ